MKAVTINRYDGVRTTTVVAKSGLVVDTIVTTNSGILNATHQLSVSNGTGGIPGRRLPNAYGFSKEIRSYGNGYSSNVSPTRSTNVSGAIVGSSMMPSIYAWEPAAMGNEVYNRALDSLQASWRGDLDLSVDGLQSRQVFKMIKQVTKLSNYVRSFSPKRWSEKWLEYQYGWKPLVSSIYGLAKEAVTPPRDGPAFYIARASASGIRKTSAFSSGITDSVVVTRRDRCEIKVCLNMKPTVLTQLSRISSLNPASIAWELLPYSFVVDWVFDIGGYLRAMESACIGGMIFNHGYVTRGTTIDRKYTRAGSQNLGGAIYTVFGAYESASRYKSRSVLSGYPRPLRPSFNISMGSSRVLSAAALLDQHLKKR